MAQRDSWWSRVWRWAAANMLFVVGFILLTGRTDLPWMWAYLAVWAGILTYAFFVLDPDLRRERFRPAGPSADPIALAFMRMSALATMIVALLDIGRFHWSDNVPQGWHAAGLVLFAIGAWLPIRSMSANRFFSPVVRVQRERGHRVIDQGPYAVVRHPGYAGMTVFAVGGALLLGSFLALVPAVIFSALVLRRVLFEDAFLQNNLEGYREYSERVRFRLVPGIW